MDLQNPSSEGETSGLRTDDQSSCGLGNHILTDPVSITCGHSFCRQCISDLWDNLASSGDFICPQCRKRTRTRPALVPIRVSIDHDSYQPADNVLHTVREKHKTSMKNKYESLFEGIKTQENKNLLNRIYTQLYIIEGESEKVNEEHEVLQIEKTPRRPQKDAPINCLDIFKPLQCPRAERAVAADSLRQEVKEPKVPEIRSVLTKGIAGIGKTVSVQKFILDWAEGEANQDVDFMFVLPFRELNLIKDDQYSLHGLLCDFHPELKDLDATIYDKIKAVFIFDGLDESRMPLNFNQCEKISDITMTSSVEMLITNLIKGELLPSAQIWITSRPAAANQIPPGYIHRVTEIEGFNDPQKEEYFKKRISDQEQAKTIISHIKAAKSLHIMCHIPVFCWISATVLQQIIKQSNTEIPKTLTEMYSHFLITQTTMKNEKYEEKVEQDPKKLLESNRTILLKLAKLAFKQLMKGNMMFHEEDLRESGIDITEASVYCGIFTEIFKAESVLYQRKVYSFVHLTFQEFLAAIYVFHCYENKNMEELQFFLHEEQEEDYDDYDEYDDEDDYESRERESSHDESSDRNADQSENVSLDYLLTKAVDKAVKSQNGHLDLFLRFLLGISLETNQRLLQGLLTQTHCSSKETTEHIKGLIKIDHTEDDLDYDDYDRVRCVSTERSINLFLCLSEMNDQSFSREIQEYLKSDKHSEQKLSPGECSALVYMLLISEKVLDELDLKKYNTSGEGYRRLIPAFSICRKVILEGCYVKSESGETLCSVLQSENNPLKELDLSYNYLLDSGVEKLSAGLNSSHCKLEILRLAGNIFTTNSCEKLASALQTVNSSLKELDLSNNDLQDSGVELLADGLKSPHCKLEKLRLVFCNLGEKAGESLGSALQSVNSSLIKLDLSNNDLQDAGVELLSDGLKSSHCKLEILRLSGCMVTEQGCSCLASALKSNPSHLKELDLTYNHPGELGVKELSDLQEDPHCKLENLQFDHGGMIRMKSGLKKYACYLTLDPNTVHRSLSLSEGNRKVKYEWKQNSYPDHPDRFDLYGRVMSVESLTGRCYLEVELMWESTDMCFESTDICLTYRGINRKCLFADSKDMCILMCSANEEYLVETEDWGYYSFSFRYNQKKTVLPTFSSIPHRVGVYLDWKAGMLTFYNICPNTHTLKHLHTFTTTFTEPLYVLFSLDENSSVRLCELE